ncbi:MAG: ABC transporter ATP-binding protein [Gammaproteobacteria bacterium]|nr:ABC transporter ATP-binding protein [Rhodocyclaceae bacterium]MBU3909308.1 ABC transporter ATP-binding protein [Gammaproteobacteria bacterium]MBU4005532.1 ABC transporter ATP-binding protein [Gammaproteobacteria bacterium]MBU4020915.1 ABC transporter ATP-binding protein [Gammaproteobacteria bacterium]MBU4096734.1 ABC transporter ATP-binding protein [Gammaproteobacteria bacterium]
MILQARALTVSIGPHRVCAGLDLDLAAGERLAILGRNGVGKSTLLATLAGLRAPDAGEIRLDGRTYAELGIKTAARLRGWLGQERGDPFASTVLETVLTGRHPHLDRWAWESSIDKDIARAALQSLGLAGMEERAIQTLSGGERQRAAIATLLAQQPRLYLLDEPLAHLDLNHQIATLELFAQETRRAAPSVSRPPGGRTPQSGVLGGESSCARRESVAVAMVLHDPNFALRFCDRALLLFGDGCHVEGPVAAVLDVDSLSRLYGHPLRRVENVFIPE